MRRFSGLIIVLVSISNVDCESTSRASDAEAMQELKKSLKAPGSLGWNGPEPCMWRVVRCSSEDRVTLLLINLENLNGGSLPPSLSNLTSLEVFGAHGNQLTGPLPSLHGLNSLSSLRLNHNNFTSIPSDFFSNMSALQQVYLDNNHFSQWRLFDSLESCRSLRTFSASSANIVGKIPHFLNSINFPSLKKLHLAFNSLEGELPDFKGFNLLEILNVTNNSLMGSIPKELTYLPNLKVLDVSNNKFCGEVPTFNSNVIVKTDGNVNLGKKCPSPPGLLASSIIS